MEESIFTKIIKGELPAHKVYEDDKTLAILDIHPTQPGQVVVFPKKQVAFVWDLEQDDYEALMSAVQKVGRRLREIFPDRRRIGAMIEGLGVGDHAHVVLLPFDTAEQYRALPDTAESPDQAALATMAERLRF